MDKTGRLIAVLIGIDRYRDAAIPDLRCSVNDVETLRTALRQTQTPDTLDLTVLVSPPRIEGAGQPGRQGILETVTRAAVIAGEDDTVAVFFAGHGGIIHGKPCLFPSDAMLSTESVEEAEASMIRVEELQSVFDGHRCRNRVMFLDCCQGELSSEQQQDAHGAGRELPGAVRALKWSVGTDAGAGFIESFLQPSRGWSVMLSCSPGELSLEDSAWGQHGIFSHFLAIGLRGEADLDGDGTVSMAELAQYLGGKVPRQAEAVIDELRRADPQLAPRQQTQTPTLAWGGPIPLPLTRKIDEGRAGYGGGVVRLWARFVFRRLPYAFAVEPMIRYGTALLGGLAVMLSLLRFAPVGMPSPWPPLAAAAGIGTGLVWIATYALAGAANEARWHSGGYLTAIAMFAWNVAVFGLAVSLHGATSVAATLRLGADLFVLVCLFVIFGYNTVQCIVALATLLKKDERVALRRAFTDLDKRRVNADIDNVIAMVSAHPLVYQVLGGVCFALVLAHAIYVLAAKPMTAQAALDVVRDGVLLVLIQWLVQWYSASYRKIRGLLLPER